MPNYDFKCQDCGNTFTTKVSIAEKDNVPCPACNSKKLQQIYGSFGVKINSNNNGCGNSCSMGGGG